ncbi:MAG TPA: chemotaxis protein CheW [Thermoanaerobaculia bacterium]|nr:chemotaxis protein CheW [Thermoanaerobaculia bacterium]
MVDLVKLRKKKAAKQAGEGDQVVGLSGGQVVETRESQDPATQQPSNSATPAPPPDNPTTRPPDHPTESKLEKFKQQAGKRRELAKATDQQDLPSAHLELLTFVIAGEQYAVDIERIVEIVTPRPVTRIPNADPSVVGIMSLRGTIVTLVDVRRKLRHGGVAAETPDTRIVVIDFHNEMIGFSVDRVLRVVKAAAGEIEPHPVVHATELDESVRGVFRVNAALTILLDLDKLLDSRALATTA